MKTFNIRMQINTTFEVECESQAEAERLADRLADNASVRVEAPGRIDLAVVRRVYGSTDREVIDVVEIPESGVTE